MNEKPPRLFASCDYADIEKRVFDRCCAITPGSTPPMPRMALMDKWPRGFFDINRIEIEYAQALVDAGWVPVMGDPHRIINWRPTFWQRVCNFLSYPVNWPTWWG